jgi:hypothetical protein
MMARVASKLVVITSVRRDSMTAFLNRVMVLGSLIELCNGNRHFSIKPIEFGNGDTIKAFGVNGRLSELGCAFIGFNLVDIIESLHRGGILL